MLEFHDGSIEQGEKFTKEELNDRTLKRKQQTTSIHNTKSPNVSVTNSQNPSPQPSPRESTNFTKKNGSTISHSKPKPSPKENDKSPLKSGALRKNLEYKSTSAKKNGYGQDKGQDEGGNKDQLNGGNVDIPASLVHKLDEAAD